MNLSFSEAIEELFELETMNPTMVWLRKGTNTREPG